MRGLVRRVAAQKEARNEVRARGRARDGLVMRDIEQAALGQFGDTQAEFAMPQPDGAADEPQRPGGEPPEWQVRVAQALADTEQGPG